jgi:hypothetical protein
MPHGMTVHQIVKIAPLVNLETPGFFWTTTTLHKTVSSVPKENTIQPHGLLARSVACLALPGDMDHRPAKFLPRQPVQYVRKITYAEAARIEKNVRLGGQENGKVNTRPRKHAKTRALLGSTAHLRSRKRAPAYARQDFIGTSKICALRAQPDGIRNKRRRCHRRRVLGARREPIAARAVAQASKTACRARVAGTTIKWVVPPSKRRAHPVPAVDLTVSRPVPVPAVARRARLEVLRCCLARRSAYCAPLEKWASRTRAQVTPRRRPAANAPRTPTARAGR